MVYSSLPLRSSSICQEVLKKKKKKKNIMLCENSWQMLFSQVKMKQPSSILGKQQNCIPS